jgi:MYXO-CTERM domain-containing protein
MRIRAVLWMSALVAIATPARADNTLTVSDPTLDAPTVITLGVQMLITGDDNYNATVAVRYKKSSDATYEIGLPLFRVHPEQLQANVPPAQFAGSIFELEPDTSYDIELHAVDPDGGDFTKTITGKTLAVPGDPQTPHAVNVSTTSQLQSALDNAQPGDVITVANGNYGPYLNVSKGGAAGNPVVIRGQSQAGVIIDGGGCTGCNVLEYYNTGYVHLENLTIQNASRAIRVQTQNTNGNVFRRLHITNVTLGITTNGGDDGYYVADNTLEGRLVWPAVYKDDAGAHANDDGINIRGSANVIAYNVISGFGDAIKTEADVTRANDFYGNDVLWSYDNAIELDTSYGNVRAFRNRFTNCYATTSFQPIYGGPAYLIRNVIVNVADEPFKLHALGGSSTPSGGLVYNNTVVKAGSNLQLSTPDITKNFLFANNLFVANPSDGYAMRWDTPELDVVLDYDGYYPDGMYELGYSKQNGFMTYPSFAAAQGAGFFEAHGLLVGASNFASGLQTPAQYQPLLPPPDVTLDSDSLAIDQGVVLTGITDGFRGAGPDLGAYELGCPVPSYGPRAQGVDESNTSYACAIAPGNDAGANDGPFDEGGNPIGDNEQPSQDGGCGCTTAPTSSSLAPLAAIALVLGLTFRRRK